MAITSVKTGSSFTNLQKYDSFLAGNTAYDPSATWLIQRITPANGATSVTFSSIPSIYKHLQIRFTYKDTYTISASWNQVYCQINSDTASNYSNHKLGGSGSAASASGTATSTSFYIYGSGVNSNAALANMVGVGIVDILDYASTSKFKTIRAVSGFDTNGNTGANQQINMTSASWRSTSAMNSISFYPDGTAFATGTTFALYGMKG